MLKIEKSKRKTFFYFRFYCLRKFKGNVTWFYEKKTDLAENKTLLTSSGEFKLFIKHRLIWFLTFNATLMEKVQQIETKQKCLTVKYLQKVKKYTLWCLFIWKSYFWNEIFNNKTVIKFKSLKVIYICILFMLIKFTFLKQIKTVLINKHRYWLGIK